MSGYLYNTWIIDKRENQKPDRRIKEVGHSGSLELFAIYHPYAP